MSPDLIYILCRWLYFASLIVLTGGSVFTVLLAPAVYRVVLMQRFRRLLRYSAILAMLSTLLLLTMQTVLMGNGWQDITHFNVWRAVLETRFGQIWQWQLVVALAGVLALRICGYAGQLTLLCSGATQLTGMALIGHAAMLHGSSGVLNQISHAVHLLAIAFWCGGLLPVLLLMNDIRRQNKNGAMLTLIRFSRYGHLAVALTFLSGLVNAGMLPGWSPVSFSLYSQLLLVKLLLVLLMCTMALINRYYLVPRFCQRNAKYQHNFVLLTLAELGIALVVLALVSVFATQPPG